MVASRLPGMLRSSSPCHVAAELQTPARRTKEHVHPFSQKHTLTDSQVAGPKSKTNSCQAWGIFYSWVLVNYFSTITTGVRPDQCQKKKAKKSTHSVAAASRHHHQGGREEGRSAATITPPRSLRRSTTRHHRRGQQPRGWR